MNDNELESSLTTALRGQSAELPQHPDLAAAAHERRRRRTRNRATWGTSLAVAAAVVGTVIVAPALTSNDQKPAEPSDGFSGTAWIPDGWRAESYADLELAVPPTWGYGDFSCAERDDQPDFDRPGGARLAVLCLGPAGYGVVISDDRIEEGSSIRKVDPEDVLRTTKVGHYTVTVVLDDATAVEAVLATVHLNEGLHANGCQSAEKIPPIGTAITLPDPRGPISVCRYHVGDGYNLVQSERLDPTESASLLDALTAAPIGRGPDSTPDQCGNSPENEAVLLRTAAGAIAWVHYTACRNNGIDLGTTEKHVTADVLHWALSPGWSGGFSSDIPFDRPRRLD